MTKWKARLVIQGMKDGPNAQDVSHLSDRDLYAPTLHKDSLRLLLSLAAGKGYSVYQRLSMTVLFVLLMVCMVCHQAI